VGPSAALGTTRGQARTGAWPGRTWKGWQETGLWTWPQLGSEIQPLAISLQEAKPVGLESEWVS